MTGRKRRVVLAVLSLVYLAVHLLTLGIHPFVHSDEVWLASLTRAMLVEIDPAATEDAFVLTPRYPHALKTLYHMVQAPFVGLSWTAFAARLPSLVAAIAVLFFTWKTAFRLGLGSELQYLAVLLLAVNPQFFYLAHLARQEMILIALFSWSLYLKLSGRPGWQAALPIAAGIFIHPNAFVIAVGIASAYLPELFPRREGEGRHTGLPQRLAPPVGFALVLAGGAVLALGVSFAMDPGFLYHYRNFGDSVGSGDSLAIKLLGLPQFLAKMARRQAGTYYLAHTRHFYVAAAFGYLLFAVAFILRMLPRFRRRIGFSRHASGLVLIIPAMLLATAVVGKYGPPTVGFFVVPSVLVLISALSVFLPSGRMRLPGRLKRAGLKYAVVPAAAVLVLALSGWSAWSCAQEVGMSVRQDRYRDYLEFLDELIEGDGRVLGNLNSGFAFEYDRLRIWRDLDSLSPGQTLETFIESEDIRWIILSDELEHIYSSRPVWNGIYGNPRWYPELEDIIERRGEAVARESMPGYAMRILPLTGRKDWNLYIYRIH